MTEDDTSTPKSSDSQYTISRRKAILSGTGLFLGGVVGGYGSNTLIDSLSGNDPNLENPSEDSTVQEFDTELITPADGIRIGSEDAPVKFVYWFDFQCSFCYRFAEDSLDRLIRDHVQTEQVEMILNPINFFGIDSRECALVSYALKDMGISEDEYLAWKKSVMKFRYEQNATINDGWADVETLAEYLSTEYPAQEIRSRLNKNIEMYSNTISSNTNKLERIDSVRTPNVGVYNVNTDQSRQVYGLRPLRQYKDIIRFIQEDSNRP